MNEFVKPRATGVRPTPPGSKESSG